MALTKSARSTLIASAGFGFLLVAPVFYVLLDIAGAEVPEHARLLQGGKSSWKGMTDAGDNVVLRFNRYGMISYESPEGVFKGPAKFSASAVTVAPIPLPLHSSLSSARVLAVSEWPSEKQKDVAVVDGVRMYRME